MADEPKPAENPAPPAEAPGSNISPAPVESADKPAGEDAPKAVGNMQPDPLSDGTVPSILTPGNGHKSVPKGKASITAIYRKADIMTTIYTFAGVVVAAGVVLGVYYYINHKNAKPTAAPKVAALNQSDLDKLNAFFDGNSAGSSAQILTVSSSSLFKNRVAVSSDLKVTGGVAVSGTTALGDLTVDKTSTLGVTNIRGQLVVAGPVSFQSPAQFGAGGTVNGNLAVTGNGSYGGSLSAGTLNVHDLSVSGTINLAGHLSISGQNPSAAAQSGAGAGASASVDGNDSAGTVTVNTGTVTPQGQNNPYPGGLLVTITFKSAYPRVPHVVITPNGQAAGSLQYYIQKTATGFTIGTDTQPKSATGYSFDFWVVQ